MSNVLFWTNMGNVIGQQDPENANRLLYAFLLVPQKDTAGVSGFKFNAFPTKDSHITFLDSALFARDEPEPQLSEAYDKQRAAKFSRIALVGS